MNEAETLSLDRNGFHAPIVMISYNRPGFVRLSMNNMVLANGSADHDVFMFIDGPRNNEDKVKQDEIQAIASSYKKRLPKLTIIRRDSNYGCRRNIVEAISQIISKYGKVIVIEDDVLVSRTFLDYMDKSLDFYEDDKLIWSINAYQSPNLRIPKDYPNDVYLDPVNMCWGWGTWIDRWNQVDFDLKNWETEKTKPEIVSRLNKAGRHLIDMIEAQATGRLKTWDVQCAYHIVKNGLMTIEPKYQLSKNIGFDAAVGGVHNDFDLPFISRQPYYNFLPRLTSGLKHDPRIFRQFEWIAYPRNLLVRILRKLWKIMAYFKPLNLEPLDIGG